LKEVKGSQLLPFPIRHPIPSLKDLQLFLTPSLELNHLSNSIASFFFPSVKHIQYQ